MLVKFERRFLTRIEMVRREMCHEGVRRDPKSLTAWDAYVPLMLIAKLSERLNNGRHGAPGTFNVQIDDVLARHTGHRSGPDVVYAARIGEFCPNHPRYLLEALRPMTAVFLDVSHALRLAWKAVWLILSRTLGDFNGPDSEVTGRNSNGS